MKTGLFTGILAVAALALTPHAWAQSVGECDWRSSAANLVEPWDEASKSFANGAVRLALLDLIEPAAAAYHLLLLSPPYGVVGDRQCRRISLSPSFGFMGVKLENITATYDPGKGLTLSLPAARYNPDSSEGDWSLLHITVNQSSGDVVATLEDAK
ncbi:hypothetical protein [Aliiroseovarius lamellibrachiae]|uniref:hypothetical protein n=1 Tax=Aliiroseovarius lamellibrachiae TaxID=1924933 RepID=UPI001BDF8B2A|nr:hypothetical protein [Aliiroseovarius lamellibrachiae]MBT2131397.1 hypothetical protein [Aliiroseovarius lamellibrachiae]